MHAVNIHLIDRKKTTRNDVFLCVTFPSDYRHKYILDKIYATKSTQYYHDLRIIVDK